MAQTVGRSLEAMLLHTWFAYMWDVTCTAFWSKATFRKFKDVVTRDRQFAEEAHNKEVRNLPPSRATYQN